MKDTLLINIFGAPGSGKSTTAALTFGNMKLQQEDVELVTEYARDLMYEGMLKHMRQFRIFKGQQSRINNVVGKVDFLITDSPLLLNIIYNKTEQPEGFNTLVLNSHKTYKNINFLLKRSKPYHKGERAESEEDSDKLYIKIKKMLNDNLIPYVEIKGDKSASKKIIKYINEEAK